MGGSVRTEKENTETFVAASKESGLSVNTDKARYMVMSRDQNAGRSHSMNTDNSPFEMVEELKYLGTTSTYENAVEEEIKRRLKSGNAIRCRILCLQFGSQKYRD